MIFKRFNNIYRHYRRACWHPLACLLAALAAVFQGF